MAWETLLSPRWAAILCCWKRPFVNVGAATWEGRRQRALRSAPAAWAPPGCPARRDRTDRTPPFSPFPRSSTYRPKGFDVTVKYTQGSWTGAVGEDVVTIPKGLNSSFLVNVATIFESENFFLPGIKWNGILGLAYAALAKVGIV